VKRCHFEKGKSPPRITARRGGCVIKKTSQSVLMDAAGVVFLIPTIGIPPRPRKADAARYFLIARTPLLCRASVKAESHGLWVSKITAASKRIDTNVSSVAILLPRRSPYCSPDPPLLIGSEGRIRGAQISNRAELRKFPFDDKQPAIR